MIRRYIILAVMLLMICVSAQGNHQVVQCVDRVGKVTKGLDGNVIALWASHGLYYSNDRERWLWQRAPVMTTVEDKLTMSYVLNYLEPMLERAGAEVYMPRERDPQENEIVMENQRMEMNAATVGQMKVEWSPNIPESGWYWVSINYPYNKRAVPDATFEVRHDGGVTRYKVNQKMGYGTWIYLGRHYFKRGTRVAVTLYNQSMFSGVVLAPTVRFGGGRGQSGELRVWECAAEWLKWAGAPYSDRSPHNGENNYRDDLRSRPHWVNWLAGGSMYNPKVSGLNIPVDLALAFHTDAGVSLDGIVGTLAIYSSSSSKLKNGKYQLKFPNGTNRSVSKRLATIVQKQIASDVRRQIEPEWPDRKASDRRYYEVTYNCVPSVLVELLSHQNFNDMRYGLDPRFKFTVCRAVYKGILRYLNGPEAVVEPLPVKDFKAMISEDGRVKLSWSGVRDSIEESAEPEYYIVYKRVDGGWDNGVIVKDTVFETAVERGRIVSYRVEAANEGGRSMPSEVLCVGVPNNTKLKRALVVNCFDRICGPEGIKKEGFVGFPEYMDKGVDEYEDYDYIGEQVDYDPKSKWMSDDAAGWGHSVNNHQFEISMGNTHDYVRRHAEAFLRAGYVVSSCSRKAFLADTALLRGYEVDFMFGEEKTTRVFAGECSYRVFDETLLTAMETLVDNGSDIVISGSYVVTDPFVDSVYTEGERLRYSKLIGAEWRTTDASQDGRVNNVERSRFMSFCNEACDSIYMAECVDALEPIGSKSSVVLRYTQNGLPAAVRCEHSRSKVTTIGFPLETLREESDFEFILRCCLGDGSSGGLQENDKNVTINTIVTIKNAPLVQRVTIHILL